MQIVWDLRKEAANRKKHGLSFDTAALVFSDPNAILDADRIIGDEQRWHTIGLAGGMSLIIVAHTIEVDGDEETIRIISARKTNRRERSLYEAAFQEGAN